MAIGLGRLGAVASKAAAFGEYFRLFKKVRGF